MRISDWSSDVCSSDLNRYVVDSLKAKGAIFVESLSQVPDDVPVVFSAHGVPKAVPAKAAARGLDYIDATCPLVSKRSEEHTSELQSLMRNSYAVFCLKNNNKTTTKSYLTNKTRTHQHHHIHT